VEVVGGGEGGGVRGWRRERDPHLPRRQIFHEPAPLSERRRFVQAHARWGVVARP
jgi:hypothetical protein